MAKLIDSTLWVDYFRIRTPQRIKQQVVEFVDDPEAAICEPVRLEILGGAARRERRLIEQTFLTLPLLECPTGLWERATLLGQQCIDHGRQPRSMDLLIAAVAIHHDAELISFDTDFAQIAKVSPLKLRLLSRVP